MFNLGFSEIIIIGIIALIFIGPRELPDIARVIGRMLNELKRATGDLSQTILNPKQQMEEELRKSLQSIQQSLTETADKTEKVDIYPGDITESLAVPPVDKDAKKNEPKS